MNEETKSYNIYLYEKRKERSMTRKEFAKSIGISPFLYSLYEKGIYFPSKKNGKKIEKALSLPLKKERKGTLPRFLIQKQKWRTKRMGCSLQKGSGFFFSPSFFFLWSLRFSDIVFIRIAWTTADLFIMKIICDSAIPCVRMEKKLILYYTNCKDLL